MWLVVSFLYCHRLFETQKIYIFGWFNKFVMFVLRMCEFFRKMSIHEPPNRAKKTGEIGDEKK